MLSPGPPHAALSSEASTFWVLDTPFGAEYGYFHHADRGSDAYLPGLLLVFVHGINSDPIRCWDDLPQRILQEARFDIDILNFRFPAGFLRKTSIITAAEALRTVLLRGLQIHYEDIIFVGHSTGGLIVKELLSLDTDGLLDRARQIINFGVPHSGSAGGLPDFVRRLAVCAEVVLSPLASVLRFASSGKYNLGRNEILSQLQHNGRFVSNLEERYVAVMQQRDDDGSSRPESIEITGEDDVVAAGRFDAGNGYRAESDKSKLRIRGTHSSIKHRPIVLRALKVNLSLESIWCKRRQNVDRAVALASIRRVEIIEDSTNVETLFREISGARASDGEDQEACFRHLQDAVHERRRNSSRRIVVTGPMGVGKSVVLRRLCRHELHHFLEEPIDADHANIIFIPIDRVSLGTDVAKLDGSSIWAQLQAQWLELANERLHSGIVPGEQHRQVTYSWLMYRLRNEPTVLILDGVDEFLSQHRNISMQHFRDVLSTICDQSREGDITVLMGVRETLLGFETLATDDNSIIRIMPLSIDTASVLLPGLADRIQTLEQADREAILTPLILAALSRAQHLTAQATPTTIFYEAMESLVDWNQVNKKIDGLAPLSLIGWTFYKRFRRELTLKEVEVGVEELVGRWERYLDALRHDAGAKTKHLEDCVSKFRQMLGKDGIRLVLERSFFFPTVEQTYSFSHEAWRDFLATLYLSLCIRHGHVIELGKIAFRVDHHERAGELLSDFQVTEDLVSSVISATRAHDDRFIVRNFVGFLGISRVAMTAPAARAIVQHCETIEPLARFVALGRLCGRSLASNDPVAPDLRGALRNVVPRILQRPDCNSITASICCCCVRAIGLPSDLMERPQPIAVEALDWVRDKNKSGEEPSDDYRSLQLSYLHSQFNIQNRPERAIMTAHYLFLLTAARINGCAISEVEEHLPTLLRDGSNLDRFFASYRQVPELHDIYLECRLLWNGFAREQ
jgi:hypothetical protein